MITFKQFLIETEDRTTTLAAKFLDTKPSELKVTEPKIADRVLNTGREVKQKRVSYSNGDTALVRLFRTMGRLYAQIEFNGRPMMFDAGLVSESSEGAHGEYVGDVAEKTMVNAIINQLFGGQKTEEHYDLVYSFIESNLAAEFYEKYYDAFKEKSEASYEHKRSGKAADLSPETARLLSEFKKDLGELWQKYKDSRK
jgi:hypothetical protein